MNLNINISMDNAAFEEDPTKETSDILKILAKKIEKSQKFPLEGWVTRVRDKNGNTVGFASVAIEPVELIMGESK